MKSSLLGSAAFITFVSAATLAVWPLPHSVNQLQNGIVLVGSVSRPIFMGITLLTTDSSFSSSISYPTDSTTYATDGNIINVLIRPPIGPTPGGFNSTDSFEFTDIDLNGTFNIVNQSFVLTPQSFVNRYGVQLGLGRLGFGQLPAGSSIIERLQDSYGIALLVGCWYSNSLSTQSGRVQFGGSEPAYYNVSEVNTHNTYVPEMGLWSLRGNDVVFANATSTFAFNWNGNFVLEPSYARMIVPRHIMQAMAQLFNWQYQNTVNGIENYRVPTILLPTLPTLQLTIDSSVYSIPPENYVNPVGAFGYRNLLIAGGDLLVNYNPVWILGLPFQLIYYTILDYQNNTVSLSPAVQV